MLVAMLVLVLVLRPITFRGTMIIAFYGLAGVGSVSLGILIRLVFMPALVVVLRGIVWLSLLLLVPIRSGDWSWGRRSWSRRLIGWWALRLRSRGLCAGVLVGVMRLKLILRMILLMMILIVIVILMIPEIIEAPVTATIVVLLLLILLLTLRLTLALTLTLTLALVLVRILILALPGTVPSRLGKSQLACTTSQELSQTIVVLLSQKILSEL